MDPDGHSQPGERIPCAYCLGTLNAANHNTDRYDVVVSTNGEYFHRACINIMREPPEARSAHLPLVPPLSATWRRPVSIDSEVMNSLTDRPLGISESRIFLHELDTKDLSVINNDTHDLELTLNKTPPWLHAEISVPTSEHPSVLTQSGRVVLIPKEVADITLVPHPVRPSNQRHYLYLYSEHYLVIHSSGNDLLVWAAFGLLCTACLLFWFAFSSLGTVFSNLGAIIDVNPMRIVTTIFRLYFYTFLTILLITVIMPSKVLWFTRDLLFSVGKLLFPPSTPVPGLTMLDSALTEHGRLRLTGQNVGELLSFIAVFSLVFALPCVFAIVVLTLLFVNLLAIGGLFYTISFLVTVYLLYRLLRNYHLPRALNKHDPIDRLRNEFMKRTQVQSD